MHWPASSADSYLNIPAILSAVAITGADAVHPGVEFVRNVILQKLWRRMA